MTNDLDLGIDYDSLAAEEARANRPSFNHNLAAWEGDLVAIDMGQDVNEKTGETFPRHAFHFEKIKVLDAGNNMDAKDGGGYTLLIRPVTPEQKTKKTTRFTEMGKSVLASGKSLEKFLHTRVRVTELAETYKARDTGYDRQSYSWKFEQIGGAGSNGASPDKEAKFKAAEEAAEIALGSTEWESESAFRTAWLSNAAVNQLSPDFNTLVMLGKWEGFKNLGTPAA